MKLNSPSVWIKDFPIIKAGDNKYDRGLVYVIAGDVKEDGSAGASKLAASAALRAGAGVVKIICNSSNLQVYASNALSVMVKSCDDLDSYKCLLGDERLKAMLIGPGNGVNSYTKEKVLQALSLRKKMILDADAITVFKDNPNELFSNINSEVVLTPHEGEFCRLFDLTDNRVESVINAAKVSNAVVLLKGNDSIIANSKGEYFINKAAPKCLATAGTGDVLAGIVTGIVAQGVDAFRAALIGVYIHSKAAEKIGRGMISEDLNTKIPEVLQDIEKLANYNNYTSDKN